MKLGIRLNALALSVVLGVGSAAAGAAAEPNTTQRKADARAAKKAIAAVKSIGEG